MHSSAADLGAAAEPLLSTHLSTRQPAPHDDIAAPHPNATGRRTRARREPM